MSYLEEIDRLFEENKFEEARKLCEGHENERKIQVYLAKMFLIEKKYKKAEIICEKYPEDPEMQSLLIKAYTKEGKFIPQKYEDAKTICRKFMKKDKVILSQYIKILIKQGQYKEAEDICKANLDQMTIKSQLVSIYIEQERFDEAKELCMKHLDYIAIKSQYVKILMKEGRLQEAEKICIEEKENPTFKSQLIAILSREGKLEEAKKIAEENKDMNVIKIQLKKIDKKLKDNGVDEPISEGKLVNEQKYINVIKTRIYMEDNLRELTNEIKESDMDDWQRTIALIALYKKLKQNKNAELVYKEAKKIFEKDEIKMKKLKSISGYIVSTKQKLFDFNILDKMINWEIDENLANEIRERRKKEEEEIEKNTEKLREENKKILEEKQEKIVKEKIENEDKKEIVDVKQEQIEKKIEQPKKQEVVTSNSQKEKKNKNKKDKKKKDTFGTLYKSEITVMKAKINGKANSSNINYIKEFSILENLEEKSITDLRAKMQFIMYLRKYGMDDLAKKDFSEEYEIYNLINNMMTLKRANPNYDDSKILEEIIDKASKLEGDNEYIYTLLDNATKKNDFQR